MSTVHQRLQIYYSQPDAIILSNRAIRRLAHNLKNHYEEKGNPDLLSFVRQTEDGVEYLVRNYPDSYDPTIDHFIKCHSTTVARNIQENKDKFLAAQEKKREQKKERKSKEKVTKPVTTRERKRTPVKRGPEKIISVKPENPTL